jgi:uncharacterized membrane protein YfcA
MNRTLQLVAVGMAAGIIAGLFGLGGGVLVVPLLVLWLGFNERVATATSLVAVLIIATVGVVVQSTYGTVEVSKALLVGIPAVGGAIAGTHLQQKIENRRISLIFGCYVIVMAILLAIWGKS